MLRLRAVDVSWPTRKLLIHMMVVCGRLLPSCSKWDRAAWRTVDYASSVDVFVL